MLGGDCSHPLASMLALRRRGRYGLAHVDGHLDFRHAGWSGGIGAVAGEDLAGVTGRLEPSLSDIDGLGPYVRRRRYRPLRRPRGDPGERAAIAQTADHACSTWTPLRGGALAAPARAVLGPRRRRRARQRARAGGRLARAGRADVRRLAALQGILLAGDAIAT